MVASFPAARGERLDWPAMPARIHSAIAEQLGEPVIDSVTQPEGFSPAVAARVRTAGGRRAFVKAVPPDRNPDTPHLYRREIAVMGELPGGLPVPRLLWSLDEGRDGWVVLMFEEVDAAHPALPWSRGDLDAVLAVLAQVATTTAVGPRSTEPAGEFLAARWCSWAQLAAQAPPGLDEWSRRHAERLADVERDLAAAVDGDALVHLDVRWDNLLVGGGRAWLVDWPWARRGAPWLDAVLFAATVEMQGGPPAEAVIASHRRRVSVDDEGMLVTVVAAAGMLTGHSLRPPPPGLPTLRSFQAAAARAYRAWLQRITGWT